MAILENPHHYIILGGVRLVHHDDRRNRVTAEFLKHLIDGDLASSSQSIFLAIMVRLIQLVWALPGILVPLSGAHLPTPDKLAELQSLAQANRAAGDSKPDHP